MNIDDKRAIYMADNTPVSEEDFPKLLEIAEKLRNEDTSLNLYELKKHPEARAKLFRQVAEACYMALELNPTEAHKLNFIDYLEKQFINTLAKQAYQTDLKGLNRFLKLAKQENKDIDIKALASDLIATGLITKEK
ncbi:hypothetical protein SAG0027_03915 [Streptococcus agalactiae FSL S3-251]|uniref:hypothetical protein n=1 Tax=Streptococcus agalactiae TaxID=1311 RepID=UPI0002FFB72E|nr:hypothetical protein [Streptococcus agalactiae]EPV90452.1 hypothetical protein SAG0027_03915 [Streptococcus agalactiae FSL S3-251]